MDALHQFRLYLTRPHVRPWALSAPILVLLVCLPLLRPLRHPDPRTVSDDELARLATIESLAERRTLDIADASFKPATGTVLVGDSVFTQQPPTLSVLLSGPYWVMRRFGLTFDENPALVAYLLTVIGVTIPVAAAAGLIHRMGRLFELRRPKRALLAAAVVFGSGLVSYGVVLNAHAPAAALVLGAVACIIHVAISKTPNVTSGWLAIAGMCAALAAAIDPAAGVFIVLFVLAIPAMRWRWPMKLGGIVLFALGAAPPILLHLSLVGSTTGDLLPPAFYRHTLPVSSMAAAGESGGSEADLGGDELLRAVSWWEQFGRDLARFAAAFLGDHGIFTHFPVLVLGGFGIAAVMHRHWPATTKVLATATVVAGAVAVVYFCVITLAGPGAMFGPQAFIVFLPLTLFWAGAWMRRPHHAAKWSLAACLLLFSTAVTLIGATNPCPRDGYDRYTVAQALSHLIHPASTQAPVLAGR